ncbi:MAG: hypothetical protein K8S54_13980 [Spirochaetia bacterium]|nr:hypothetical protein [Spirochaetia bacterium]
MNKNSALDHPPLLSRTLVAIASVAFVFCASCTIQKFESPGSPQRVVLLEGSGNTSCREHRTHHRYYALFGAIPLYTPPLDLSDATRSYRITEKSTWLDAVITAVFGFLLSLRRDTVAVEICDPGMIVLSPAKMKERLEEEREKINKEVAKAQEEKLNAILDALKPDPKLPELQAVFLKNGEILRGEISESTTSEIFVRTSQGETRKVQRADVVRIVYLSKEHS